MAKGFRFVSWLAVLHYAETHPWFYYHAPLDYSPVVVAVRRVFKNGKIRITRGNSSWTIDAGHLDRCSYPD
jgi:hypothetical protein